MSSFSYEIDIDAHEAWEYFDEQTKKELAMDYAKEHFYGRSIDEILEFHQVTKDEIEEFIQDNTKS